MTLEETRDAIARLKKKRRRHLVSALCLLAASIAIGAVALSRIMPLYGQWEYENRRESHTMCLLDGPTFLYAEIHYKGGAPSDLRLTSMDGDMMLRDMRCADDPASKTLTVTCDVPADAASGACTLSLVPADNYELEYLVEAQPSYKYVDGQVTFYKDEAGDLWVRAQGDYGRCSNDSGMRLNVTLKGSSYLPTLYDGWIPADPDDPEHASGSICLNLSEIMLWKRVDISKGSQVEAILQADYIDPYSGDPSIANLKSSVLLREYPDHDPGLDVGYDMAETMAYIQRLNLKAPEGREQSQDEDAAPADGEGQETAQ